MRRKLGGSRIFYDILKDAVVVPWQSTIGSLHFFLAQPILKTAFLAQP
jgi:hypothetical protein